jgi:hypothetical protein
LEMRLQLLSCVDIHLRGKDLPLGVTDLTKKQVVGLEMQLQRAEGDVGVKDLQSPRNCDGEEGEESASGTVPLHRCGIGSTSISARSP